MGKPAISTCEMLKTMWNKLKTLKTDGKILKNSVDSHLGC